MSGEFAIPECVRMDIQDLFDCMDISLYSILHATCLDSPDLIAYLEKQHVRVMEGDWHCLFRKEFTLQRSMDYLQVEPTSINLAHNHRKGKGIGNAGGEPDVGRFRYNIDDEFEVLGNVEVICGDDIDGELARRLVESIPPLKNARPKIQDQIDLENYCVTIDEDRGPAITYARTTQRNRNRKVFEEAQDKLERHNMRTFPNSFSALFTSEGFAKYAEGAVFWRQWHASWVYNTPPSVHISRDMPTPSDIALLEGVNINRPEDEDWNGFISGTEPSGDPSSDSSDDATSEEETL